MIAVLAGGVGAARYLAGLVQVVEPAEIVTIVNTGDDLRVHSLYVCPDLDTITYTLSGAGDKERGWGLAGETWNVLGALERFGVPTWFRLGDKDFATHLYRSQRLADGASLTEVTAEITASFGLSLTLLPMSDDPVRTIVGLAGGEEISFQDYFVRLAHDVVVAGLRFEGVESARAGRGVLAAIEDADQVVIAPSNPFVSIGPILALRGVRERLVARRDSVVGISPIVGGKALKGPADRLLVELGSQSSALGVAQVLGDVIGTLVIDEVDADLSPEIRALGISVRATDTVMSSPEIAAQLARVSIA